MEVGDTDINPLYRALHTDNGNGIGADFVTSTVCFYCTTQQRRAIMILTING